MSFSEARTSLHHVCKGPPEESFASQLPQGKPWRQLLVLHVAVICGVAWKYLCSVIIGAVALPADFLLLFFSCWLFYAEEEGKTRNLV